MKKTTSEKKSLRPVTGNKQGVRIVLIVEGKTEKAFLPKLREFLATRIPAGQTPKLRLSPYDGRIPKGEKLRRVVENWLKEYDHAIALTDVYTGTQDFSDAADAKKKMREWVGEEKRFHPHAAQHDFEAWLLPFWNTTIQKLAGTNQKAPTGKPENVNHNKPPAHRLQELFERGNCRDSYSKPRDGMRILRDNELLVAANACPELKEFLNTIIRLSGGDVIP